MATAEQNATNSYLEYHGLQRLYGKIKRNFYESPDISVSDSTLIIQDTSTGN